ncbi:MAG TPA: phytoene desaturase family protein, partial [Mycobacteriales bacterium]
GAGRRVTVLEREPQVGGRCGRLDIGGYAFDTGPTVLTMPDLIADALDCVGEHLEDWLELVSLDPIYRSHHADGSVLDVLADPEAMEVQVRAACGAAEADGYRRYVRFVSALYRAEMRTFIDRNIDSPLDLARPDLLRLAALGGFRRLAPRVGSFLRDERLRRLLSFQAMYAGLSPYDALAIYAVIAYMDSVAGVFVPRGGMHALPQALAGAAGAHGVDIRCSTGASRLVVSSGRASAVELEDGSLVTADAFVLTPDLPVAHRDLLGSTPRRVARQSYSPSCFLLLAGSTRAIGAAQHEIHFGRAWKETFAEIIDRGQLMSDPSFLVTRQSLSEPGLAPAGRQAYSVLFPTPNATAPIDWSVVGPRYRDEVLSVLADRGFADLDVLDVTTPADWKARGLEAGAPFAAAHTFRQTGPFRAPNLSRSVENVVFAGSGTTPGVGVPMVLISGRLAAERITGPDPSYRSRAWL